MKLIIKKYYQAFDGKCFDISTQEFEPDNTDIKINESVAAACECYEADLLNNIIIDLRNNKHITIIGKARIEGGIDYVYREPMLSKSYHSYGLLDGVIFKLNDMEAVTKFSEILPKYHSLLRVLSVDKFGTVIAVDAPKFMEKDIGKLFTVRRGKFAGKDVMLIEKDITSRIQALQQQLDELTELKTWFDD